MKWWKKIINFFFAPYMSVGSRTVRYAFPMMFVAVTLLGAAVINSNTQSFIRIESSESSVKAGDLFSIDVYVSAHVPVNAVDIALDFPKTQIEITGIDVGQSVITLWTEDPYVDGNSVVLRGGTFRRGFKGEHLIATINAKAKTSGLALFEASDVVLLAGDGTGSEVAVSSSGQESAQLYVANEDGTFVTSSEGNSGVEATVTVRIVTDIDGDGSVSLGDLSRFMAAWASKAEVFDFTGDGRMTFRDFAIILSDAFFK